MFKTTWNWLAPQVLLVSYLVSLFVCYTCTVWKNNVELSFGRCGTDAVLEEDYQQRIQQLDEVRIVIIVISYKFFG